MKILAVDTSSRNCSVSIVEVDKNKNINVIAQGNNDDERTHSVKLMPMIDNMFKTSNLSLDNRFASMLLRSWLFYRNKNWNCNNEGICRCKKHSYSRSNFT